MSIGKEIPFRRSKHDHDTGSLVFDQERKAGSEGESAKKVDATGSGKRDRVGTSH